ncbi:MAG TPA: hypothetical protein VGW77_34005 [Candidatus Binatia bacterium]|jgi:tripartite-type tricarboxylate transporter receptor subunit TctC|nr:hypothetical protein [Candidatus Binatia bacterium]
MERFLEEQFLARYLGLAGLSPNHGFSQAPFYQGKTITIIAGTAPGGIGDNRVKAIVPFLRKYIPGNPATVIQYMDGGGGRQVGNHMYSKARPDGLTMGAFSSSVIGLNLLGESGVMYDIDKFFYLGSPESDSHLVFYTRKEAGLSNVEKLRAASGVKVGARLVGHSADIAARFFAYFLGLKEPKFIPGYGAPELDLALLRGEVRQSEHGDIGLAAESRLGGKRSDGFPRHFGGSQRAQACPLRPSS